MMCFQQNCTAVCQQWCSMLPPQFLSYYTSGDILFLLCLIKYEQIYERFLGHHHPPPSFQDAPCFCTMQFLINVYRCNKFICLFCILFHIQIILWTVLPINNSAAIEQIYLSWPAAQQSDSDREKLYLFLLDKLAREVRDFNAGSCSTIMSWAKPQAQAKILVI